MGSKLFRNQFFIFLEPRNKRKKTGKYRIFRRKIGDYSRFFADFVFFRFSFVKIVFMLPKNRFFTDKSAEKSNFLFTGYVLITLPKHQRVRLICFAQIQLFHSCMLHPSQFACSRNRGSKNRSTLVIDSGLIESIPLSGMRPRVDRLKLGGLGQIREISRSIQ